MTNWRLIVETSVESPQVALAFDEALLQQPQPTLRIWQNRPCVVLGRFDVRLPDIEKAIHVFQQENMALLKRTSGGTAVWHSDGVLNVSVFVPQSLAPSGVHESFEALAEGMIKGLKLLDIKAGFGQVPGTYCDGPHNLIVDGKKVAGLAQTRRRGGVLVHASILVNLNLDLMHDWIERFYAEAGAPQSFARDKVITLNQACDGSIGFQDVVEAMAQGYSNDDVFLNQESFTEKEIAFSKILSSEILLA